MNGNMEVPKGWIKVSLAEIATYINGRAFKPKEWSKEGLPIIRIQNLNREISEFNFCNFAVDEKYYVNKGDLLFAWSGTPGTSFGAHIWTGGRTVLNQHIFRIIVDEKKISKKYYLHALNHKVKEFVNKAHGTAGLAHITKKKFEESMLPLPPLAEQQRIVAKIEELFSSLDKGIESLKTAQQQLKVYRQSVLKWAFEGKLTKSTLRQAQGAVIPVAQGTVKPVTQGAVMPVAKGAVMPVAQDAVKPVAEPVEATNKESEFPEGWEWVKIEDVADMQAGIAFKKSEYSSHGVRLFQIANVSFNFIKWEEIEYLPVKYIDQYPELLLNIGDIVMALNRPMLNNQLKIAEIRKDDVPAILYQRVGRFKFFGNLFNRYFLYYLQSPLFIRWLNEQLQGVNIPFINKAKLLRYDRFPLPSSIEEQHRIVAEIESRLSVCDKIEESIEESLRQAEALRQSILKKAFEGKLVAQDPNDLPASTLLARIKAEREKNKKNK